jgi:hypothetical protein
MMMKTIYVKDLSGAVTPIELSPSDLLYPAVTALGVEPGYTFKLFSDQQEELSLYATPQDGETIHVVYMPIETSCRILNLQPVPLVKDENTWEEGEFYEKIMIEILGNHIAFDHHMFFYTNVADVDAVDKVYIPSSSVRVIRESGYEDEDEDDFEDRILLTGETFGSIEDLIENLVPRRFSDEIRTQLKEQILKIWERELKFFSQVE